MIASLRRIFALCVKESYQMVRDPSSIAIAFVLPVIMLFIYSYGLNLDSGHLRLALVREDSAPEAARFCEALGNTPYIRLSPALNRIEAVKRLQAGEVRGIVIIPGDFSLRLARQQTSGLPAPVQLFTDGSEPNTAAFVQAYVSGAWQVWQQQLLRDKGLSGDAPPAIRLQPRFWFNPPASSRNFLIPGSISLIMTVIGALLSSLVIAREWERGTMEALLSTRVTKAELLLSKLIPYFGLGMVSMLLCTGLAVFVMDIPMRGNLAALAFMTGLFLLSSLGVGLMISTIAKNQFLAAQAAMVSSYLPALMLSGFVFEISSMPAPVRAVTYLFPARYFVSSLQCIFQAGVVWDVLLKDAACLVIAAALFLTITFLKTGRSLE